MIYVQMLNQLMVLNEAQRRLAIAQHAQQVFDPGFVAFVRTQVAQSQMAPQPQGVVGHLMSSFGLNPVGRLMEQQRDAVVIFPGKSGRVDYAA